MKIHIKTDRLIIREYQESELDSYCNLLLDSEVNKYLGSWVPTSKDSAKKLFIEEVIGKQAGNSRSNYFLAVELNSSKDLIGNVGFSIINDHSIADIGWILHKQYWGFGYATEAAISIINFAFTNHITTKFITSCKKENHQSERIMKKIGFVFDKEDEKRLYYLLENS